MDTAWAPGSDGRDLHVLVHNVSHSDLVLGLAPLPSAAPFQVALQPFAHLASQAAPQVASQAPHQAASQAASQLPGASQAQAQTQATVGTASASAPPGAQAQNAHSQAQLPTQGPWNAPLASPTASSSGGGAKLTPLTATFAKPAFQRSFGVASDIIDFVVRSPEAVSLIRHHVGGSSPAPSPLTVGAHASASVGASGSSELAIPVGFGLATPMEMDWGDLVLRNDQYRRAAGSSRGTIAALYFPIVAALLPKWQASIQSRGSKHQSKVGTKKVLYLVSGTSMPADPSYSDADTSTEGVAVLAARFLRMCYPDVIVHHVASGRDVLKYDSNVHFLKDTLIPLIDVLRRSLVAFYGDAWHKHFSLAISMAAGAPARLAALNAALRQYHPQYLHMPNVKAFWYSGDIGASLASILYLDFDSIEGTPPVLVDDVADDDVSGFRIWGGPDRHAML